MNETQKSSKDLGKSIDLSKCPDVICLKCGGNLFQRPRKMKRLSVLITPDGQERLANIDVFVCFNCKEELGKGGR